MKQSARYVIGIDLGTTTCALFYIDLLDSPLSPKAFLIPQWESEAMVGESPILPSYCYLPPKALWKKGQLVLDFFPSKDPINFAVGMLARQKSVLETENTVQSAKSWLSHSGIDRTAKILPWNSDTILGDERLSPVEASARYLAHLRYAWDYKMAAHSEAYSFKHQQIVITVPASFDEVASRLTLKAAELADFNLDNVRLLEEPQAAFYSWLSDKTLASPEEWQRAFGWAIAEHLNSFYQRSGQDSANVLVCDIGGGTTDFSLFKVNGLKEPTHAVIERIAVSEHILLGGDNLDLKLAAYLEELLARKLTPKEWGQLIQQAKLIKEKALNNAQNSEEFVYRASIAGVGANLFSSAQSVEVSGHTIQNLLIDSFFPIVDKNDTPTRRLSGLVELGLPYALEPAITKHLAAFLGGTEVAGVLYTGGSLIPKALRERLNFQLEKWQNFPPIELENTENMELAVSRGACVYGASLLQQERAIKAGYPRSLYVAAFAQTPDGQGSTKYICLVNKGYDFSKALECEVEGLRVIVGKPVTFQLFASNKRDRDKPGDLIEREKFSDLHRLAPLQTRLSVTKNSLGPKQDSVRCRLRVELSETGLLELYCTALNESGSQTWKLEFAISQQIKSDSNDNQSVFEPNKPSSINENASCLISELFGKPKKDSAPSISPGQLVKELESTFAMPRENWNLRILRSLWDDLKKGESKRVRSENHEATWLNLVGYVLRPGFGDELDSFRINDLWQIFSRGPIFQTSRNSVNQWWIMWRRVAGGLNKNQQELLFGKIFPAIRNDESLPEMYMLAGSLERIDNKKRLQLANILVDQLFAEKLQYADQKLWALARIASRIPFYTGLESVIRPTFVEQWLEKLASRKFATVKPAVLIQFYFQAARRIGIRELDLSEQARNLAKAQLLKLRADSELIEKLETVQKITQSEQNRLFGENLPDGFIIV